MVKTLVLAAMCLALPGALASFYMPTPRAVSNPKDFTAQWVQQPLDHFNPSDMRAWNQRYFEEPSYYYLGGPVFIMLEGEDSANPLWLQSSHMIELAQKFRAAAFLLEHRFYGESRPTNDTSSDSLRFLTAQQAIADVAHFIQHLQSTKKVDADAKVILFGGSYAGNLATWARQKYPHLVFAAVASGAPLQLQADYPGFFELVAQEVASQGGEWCLNNIKTAMDRAEELLKTTDGMETVRTVFRACADLDMNNSDNIHFMYEILADPWAQAVANNQPTQKGKSNTIVDLCENLKGDNMTPDQVMQAYGDMIAKRENVAEGSCIMPYSFPFMIMLMNFVQWGSPTADRQWTYQTCSQLGMYQTGSSPNQPWGKGRFPLEFFSKVCSSSYGVNFDSNLMANGINAANEEFGGLDLDVTRVIFVTGGSDPWRSLARTKKLNDDSPAIVIDGASHCYDMLASDPYDSKEVKNARKLIGKHIDKFLYNHWPIFWN